MVRATVNPEEVSHAWAEGLPSIDSLRAAYPWCRVLRGGILAICEDRILFVKERDRIMINGRQDMRGAKDIVYGFYGPVKGGIDISQDKTILDTAIREFREEVGLEIAPGDVSYPVIIYPRIELGELIVYFPVLFASEPQLQLNEQELDGYKWVAIGDLQSLAGSVSVPTAILLEVLPQMLG